MGFYGQTPGFRARPDPRVLHHTYTLRRRLRRRRYLRHRGPRVSWECTQDALQGCSGSWTHGN